MDVAPGVGAAVFNPSGPDWFHPSAAYLSALAEAFAGRSQHRPWAIGIRMTFGLSPVLRAAGLALAALALTAAGEYPGTAMVSPAVVQTLMPVFDHAVILDDDVTQPEAQRPARLSELVVLMSDGTLPATFADTRCLARAVYFEARGEPLEGQLAVAQVILNRVATGRYASSVCGVIDQPRQFSFAHERAPRSGNDWRVAEAIARIAMANQWTAMAPRAVSFHADHVAPGWGLQRVAQIGHHVFYR